MTCRLDLIKERADDLEEEYEEQLSDGCTIACDISEPVCDVDAPVDSSYTRSDKDVVISGPLGGAKGHGRPFNTVVEALHWAMDKYGETRVSLVPAPEGAVRWAVLVKNLRA